jgi:hypothetical protein
MTNELHERERRLADAGLGVRTGTGAIATATIKKFLRRRLGDGLTSTVHALRFAWRNSAGV